MRRALAARLLGRRESGSWPAALGCRPMPLSKVWAGLGLAGIMLAHYTRNLAVLGTVLLVSGAGATVVGAHLQLADAQELASEALRRLESEVARAQEANLTSQQGPLG